MMPRQYITAKFRPDDAKAYTFHYDGQLTLKPGDAVEVPGKAEGTKKRVWVAELGAPKPEKYDTKPIFGLAPHDATQAAAKVGGLFARVEAGDDADLERRD